MKRKIQVFEHESLTLQSNERGEYLQDQELNSLYSFNDKNNYKYFTGIRGGIKFKSYVGVIQVGELTLEILPKADNAINHTKEGIEKWQNFLLSMLSICKKIRIDSVSEATLRMKNHSLLDLYFEIFLEEVELILRKGLVRKYLYESKNINSLKGKIVFDKHLNKNIIHKEKFFCKHQVYNPNHLLNQIIFKALHILQTLTTSSYINDRLNRVLLNYPELDKSIIIENDFKKIQFNRKTISYEKAIQIAKMIILNYSPDIQNGSENMLAILFDMNKLWEEYILQSLLNKKDNNTEIAYQEKQDFWDDMSIRPDIIVRIDEQPFIIDAKWKIVEDDYPSNDDLKQIYTYNMYWDATKSLLVYPRTQHSNNGKCGSYHKGREKENMCKLYFADVCNENGKLDFEIGKKILNEFRSAR